MRNQSLLFLQFLREVQFEETVTSVLELTERSYAFLPKIKLKDIETIFEVRVCGKAENNYHTVWPATLSTLVNM